MRTRILTTAGALCLAVIGALLPAQSATPKGEVRGVWIPNTATTFFDSRENVAAGMAELAAGGINVVFPVVWSKGWTLYPSATLERVVGKVIDPRYAGRDPLAEVLFEAHRHGIEVVPWFEYGFTAGHESLGAPVLDARPGWAAIGKDGKPVVKNGFHWMNPMDPEVQAFAADLVLEVCREYDVDGVQGDDRLPAMPCEAGYDAGTRELWLEHANRPPPDDVRDPEWTKWRADRLTDWLAELRAAVKAIDEDLVFSMAPGGPGWAYREYLQDQATWVQRGLVDTLHPQLYAREPAGYRKMVDDLLGIEWIAAQRALVSPGVLVRIGDWHARPDFLVGTTRLNRERGMAGEVFFFHQGLLDRDAALLRALAKATYAKPAPLPWRTTSDWRPPAIEVAPTAASKGWRKREVDRKNTLELAAEDEGQVAWSASVPADGAFVAYVLLPNGIDEELVFRLEEASGDRALVIGAEAAAPGGWIRVGTLALDAGEDSRIATLTIQAPKSKRGPVLVGPMLLMPDRSAGR